jgi:Cupin domain
MTTTCVRWMVGMVVVGLSLAGGLALAAESQGVNIQGQVMTGDQQQQAGDYVMYIVSGQGTATIDGQQVPFEPGTVLYIPNGAPYSIKTEGGDLTLKMLIGLGNLNAELSGTLNLETFSFDPAPVSDGPAGTFAFTSDFCNIGSKRLNELKSVTTTLTGGNILRNRDDGTIPGVGSELTFPANGGYADRILEGGECVAVLYQIGLAVYAPFEFMVDVVGMASEPEVKHLAASLTSERKSHGTPSLPIRLIGGGDLIGLERLVR